MKNLFARLAAAAGLSLLLGVAAAAQMAPGAPGTAVKSHVRHMKSGKTVLVHGYTRAKKPMMKPKMTKVHAYARHMKSGKTVMVHGYTRRPAKTMKAMKK